MHDLHNITEVAQRNNENNIQAVKPQEFYVCSEDFKIVGIHAHIFGGVCFVLVYAIPGE